MAFSPVEVSKDKSNNGVRRHREDRLLIPSKFETKVAIQDFYGSSISGVLKNISRFGARVTFAGEDLYFRNDQQFHAQIDCDGRSLYQGSAKFVGIATPVEGGISVGIQFLDGEVDLGFVLGILGLEVGADTEDLKQIVSNLDFVDPSFKNLFSDFIVVFSAISSKLDEVEASVRQKNISIDQRGEEEGRCITEFYLKFEKDIQDTLSALSKLSRNYNHEAKMLHKSYVRAVAQKTLIANVPFINRAYTKPLGYAGDYGLMAMLYDYRDLGESLRDKFWHRYSCNSPAAMANKNRVHLLAGLISKQVSSLPSGSAFKVTSVACGPAKEVDIHIGGAGFRSDIKYEFVLVDQDQGALDYAMTSLRRKYSSRKNIEFRAFKEDAVMGIIRQRPFVAEMAASDLVISAGLFDYLSDRVATKMIASMFESLKPGSRLIIGNVSDDNPDTFAMDYLMEWNLVLRSELDMIRLVPDEIRKRSDVSSTVIAEPLDLNLFLEVSRK